MFLGPGGPTGNTAAIGFRGSAATPASTGSATSSSLTVPSGVVAGDGMVLVSSVNLATAVVTAPAGWTLRSNVPTGNLVTRIYSKVATATDGGSRVTVSTDVAVKSTLQLTVYSGTSTVDPIRSLASAIQGATTTHTTPTSTAPAGSWVVSVWSDKQAVARTWTAPGGVAVLSNVPGAASGGVATLLADSGGPVAAGTVGGLQASVPTASNQATVFTIVLAAG
jgi:hypothetical protein